MASDSNTTGNDDEEQYPYNQPHGIVRYGPTVAPCATCHIRAPKRPGGCPPAPHVFRELVQSPEHVARMNPNLIKSLVMIGTDFIRGSSSAEIVVRDEMAVHLALLILHIEEFLRHVKSFGVMIRSTN
jgi:hypothetical protein